MTVVVGIYCHDGVVIATYSMLTASLGTTAVGHHHAKKLYLIQGSQIVSCSGDPGLAARFRFVANNCHKDIEQMQPLEYGIKLSQEICVQFQSTGLNLAEVDLGVMISRLPSFLLVHI
jgi:hypothetical protein